MQDKRLLKKDLFGEVWKTRTGGDTLILRDSRPASWWVAWLARRLLRREARALAALAGIDGVPRCLASGRTQLERSFIAGVPMCEGRPQDPRYFKAAAQLLRRLHRANVVHNDLAKEPNILVQNDGAPAFIDFQLAWHAPGRNRLFRIAAREDIRHLLKHKRTYCPDRLTARERAILANPSPLARAWMRFAKPVYLLVTRRVLGWSDREGATDRGHRE